MKRENKNLSVTNLVLGIGSLHPASYRLTDDEEGESSIGISEAWLIINQRQLSSLLKYLEVCFCILGSIRHDHKLLITLQKEKGLYHA